MKAEGSCPDCGSDLGVKVGGGIAATMGDTIKRMMDRDGNAMLCDTCGEYKDPEDLTVKD